jgi:hypothetical protein
MKRNRAISEFIKEAGLVIRGLIDAGYTEQFHRIGWEMVNDFFLTFCEGKQYFALFSDKRRGLKYYAFDDEESAQDAIKKLRRADDDSEYRILPRTIVEMVGRELEYHQYREITALNDAEAEEARQKQQELIDFVFSSK